ncbi:MAG: glycerol-3-phosphate 1-O-acyltransferase PlsY [Fusobacteriaceae bacterium]
MVYFLIMVVISYLFGALPNGVWVGKISKNIDIREYGSKNSGATNAYRTLGAKYGILVLILDALKGYLPLLVASSIFGITGTALISLGLVSIIGHTLSIFLNFNGGKGVATSLGVFLFLFPKGILLVFVIFSLVVYFTKYISLGSVIGAGILPFLVIFMDMKPEVERVPLFIVAFLVAIFVIYKHKSNIERLRKGTENKFNVKK